MTNLSANGLPLELDQLATGMQSFILSLLKLPPSYAASTLGNRLFEEQQRGRAHLARALEWLGHYVETLPMPETLRPLLRGELIRARIHGENEQGNSPVLKKLAVTTDREQLILLEHTLPPSTPAPRTEIPIDFSFYIKEEYREKLVPFLKTQYTGSKPQALACMLIALKDLEALKTTDLQANVTRLHVALKAFLNGAGTRQSLADNLTKLDKASEKQNLGIQGHRAHIQEYMKQS